MTFTHTETHDSLVISIIGNLIGEHQQYTIIEFAKHYIETHTKPLFIIDLANLEAINSVGLNILLGILTKSRNADGDTVLRNIPQRLSKMLVITKLNAIFTVENILTDTEILVTV